MDTKRPAPTCNGRNTPERVGKCLACGDVPCAQRVDSVTVTLSLADLSLLSDALQGRHEELMLLVGGMSPEAQREIHAKAKALRTLRTFIRTVAEAK